MKSKLYGYNGQYIQVFIYIHMYVCNYINCAQIVKTLNPRDILKQLYSL